LAVCKSHKETDAGADMEQRRRQPVWKAESRRKREKRIARLRRRIIAYTVRGIVAAVLAVMLLLMVCGCLYIRDFFRKNNKNTALKADSVRDAVPGVEENKPDTDFAEQEKYR
jgi:cell division septal protein FtsQ